MTDTFAVNLEEALALIDEGLGFLHTRELMSSNEVADMLLDLRVLLVSAAAQAPETVPVPS